MIETNLVTQFEGKLFPGVLKGCFSSQVISLL